MESFGEFAGKNRGLHKININELINFWQPTGFNVRRNHQKVTSTSKCTEYQEMDDQMHYMKCKSKYFSEARTFAWKRLNQKMKRYKREETLLRVIWIGIQNWIHNDFEGELPRGDDVTSEEFEALKLAYENQNKIGWKHFLVGRIS